jgi:hypothetical protein
MNNEGIEQRRRRHSGSGQVGASGGLAVGEMMDERQKRNFRQRGKTRTNFIVGTE